MQLGQTYYYEVSAVVSGVETLSSWDVSAKLLLNPTPVQNLRQPGNSYGASLQWQPPTNAVTGPVEEYIVQAGGFTLAELQALCDELLRRHGHIGAERDLYGGDG